MTTLRLRAPAKLNLVLKVRGRRADGYHLLETLFHAIDLQDELVAQRAPDGPSLAIAADGARAQLAAEDDNLVLRSARAFAQRTGTAAAFRFWLHKRIPPGGGLGGGSSDAAAALRLCNALAGGRLGDAALHELARGLGADVPFFLRCGSQWGRGIGDELAPATVAPRSFVLVVPPFGCPTAEVYKNLSVHWNATFDAASIRPLEGDHHKGSVLRRFENDLQEPAERVRPELRQLREQGERLLGAPLHVTGSGSTLFAACDDAADLAGALQRLQPLAAAGCELAGARSLAALPQVELVAADDPWWRGEEVRSWAR